jgi:hypothetical protein
MTAWRALAGPVPVGQGRSREAVARSATALTDCRWSGLLAASGLAGIFCKVWADGGRIVEMLDVLGKTYGKGVSEEARNLKTPQPHAPGRRRRFYLAVLIDRPTSTPRCDFSFLRNRAPHVSGPCDSSAGR